MWNREINELLSRLVFNDDGFISNLNLRSICNYAIQNYIQSLFAPQEKLKNTSSPSAPIIVNLKTPKEYYGYGEYDLSNDLIYEIDNETKVLRLSLQPHAVIFSRNDVDPLSYASETYIAVISIENKVISLAKDLPNGGVVYINISEELAYSSDYALYAFPIRDLFPEQFYFDEDDSVLRKANTLKLFKAELIVSESEPSSGINVKLLKIGKSAEGNFYVQSVYFENSNSFIAYNMPYVPLGAFSHLLSSLKGYSLSRVLDSIARGGHLLPSFSHTFSYGKGILIKTPSNPNVRLTYYFAKSSEDSTYDTYVFCIDFKSKYDEIAIKLGKRVFILSPQNLKDQNTRKLIFQDTGFTKFGDTLQVIEDYVDESDNSIWGARVEFRVKIPTKMLNLDEYDDKLDEYDVALLPLAFYYDEEANVLRIGWLFARQSSPTYDFYNPWFMFKDESNIDLSDDSVKSAYTDFLNTNIRLYYRENAVYIFDSYYGNNANVFESLIERFGIDEGASESFVEKSDFLAIPSDTYPPDSPDSSRPISNIRGALTFLGFAEESQKGSFGIYATSASTTVNYYTYSGATSSNPEQPSVMFIPIVHYPSTQILLLSLVPVCKDGSGNIYVGGIVKTNLSRTFFYTPGSSVTRKYKVNFYEYFLPTADGGDYSIVSPYDLGAPIVAKVGAFNARDINLFYQQSTYNFNLKGYSSIVDGSNKTLVDFVKDLNSSIVLESSPTSNFVYPYNKQIVGVDPITRKIDSSLLPDFDWITETETVSKSNAVNFSGVADLKDTLKDIFSRINKPLTNIFVNYKEGTTLTLSDNLNLDFSLPTYDSYVLANIYFGFIINNSDHEVVLNFNRQTNSLMRSVKIRLINLEATGTVILKFNGYSGDSLEDRPRIEVELYNCSVGNLKIEYDSVNWGQKSSYFVPVSINIVNSGISGICPQTKVKNGESSHFIVIEGIKINNSSVTIDSTKFVTGFVPFMASRIDIADSTINIVANEPGSNTLFLHYSPTNYIINGRIAPRIPNFLSIIGNYINIQYSGSSSAFFFAGTYLTASSVSVGSYTPVLIKGNIFTTNSNLVYSYWVYDVSFLDVEENIIIVND